MQSLNKVNTPFDYMLELDWDKGALEDAIKFLNEWDKRNANFYKNHNKINIDFDQSEKEHYRNCIKFWTERLKNENQSP